LKEENKAAMEGNEDNCKGKRESYCPHYERDTCLIHFKCCPEEKWYPCHKCHNAAVSLIENPNDKAEENDIPSDHIASNNMASENSDVPEERSSYEVEVNSEHEGHQVQDGSASEVVENAENPVAETSNDLEPNSEEPNKSKADTDRGAAEENKAAMEETEDNCNSESKSYCPHYERDTCLIHYKCCPEEKRYPCHKCHNAAVALIENPNDEGQENDRQTDHIMVGEISNSPEERSSNGAGLISEHEGHQVQECGSAGDPENPVAEPSNDPEPNSVESDKSKADADGAAAVKMGDEIDSGATQGFLPSSPTGTKTIHSVATALEGTQVQCTGCGQKQKFSKKCESCDKLFANYFCDKCKLLIQKEVDAYHCDKCGICRGNKADHFHCDECNICMAQTLRENHKCFADRGHDPCAICFEEVFSGAIIFPCFHMIHKECAERLLLSGSRTCPMCRSEIFPNDEDQATAEDTSQQNPPDPGFWTSSKNCLASLWKKLKTSVPPVRNTPLCRDAEMNIFVA